METVAPRLDTHKVVGIDTSIFIYVFEDSATYGAIASAVLKQVEDGRVSAVTSFVSLMEILVLPLRQGYPDIADAYGILLGHFRNLDILPIDARVARQAARLRAENDLGPADALQIGACLIAGATAFVTNDKRLRRVQDIDILVLDDFVH